MNSPRPVPLTPRLAPQQVYNQQPNPTQNMSLGGGDRNAFNKPIGADGQRDWSFSLTSCMDNCGLCLCSFCVPCVQHGRNKNRYQYLLEHGKPDPDQGGCCNSSCMGYGALSICGLSWIPQLINRGAVRGRYGIRGGGCGDFCASTVCAPCSLVQTSREIQLEEESFQMRQLH